ncbi:MAG TPA: sigma factor-like helix-turn-helix DNA-binding protein, partial [Nannocystaceae bacterium]|nr:sigma factor-like helix-turn-helix DNA-binding protein [Nannocystaceae bacterium]
CAHRWRRGIGRAFDRMVEHARRDDASTGELDEGLAAATDLEHVVLRAEARAALADALSTAVSELDAEDRALLRLHVSDQLGIDDIARLYGVHRATAARRVDRARRELGRLTRRRLATALALPPWEVESLVRIVRSSFRSLVKTYLVEGTT